MKNVFLQRIEDANYVIIPDAKSEHSISVKTAILIFLYYIDTLAFYYSYIDCIIGIHHVDVYLITSSDEVEKRLLDRYRDAARIIKKANRGRDVSALLLTAREFLLYDRYQYICFVHDKKARGAKDVPDVNLWVRDLWENTLASRHYVQNILYYFETHDACGLLVPPEPFGAYQTAWFGTAWRDDFQNTKKLADCLGINADIREEYPPIALGTAFWCRSAALEKLFRYPWKEEDFPEEPLPVDGTLSHAIERILPYVAQDASYITKTVMTSAFCFQLLAYLQDTASYAGNIFKQCLEIHNVAGLKALYKNLKLAPEYFSRKKKVYLFGAGRCGRACLHILRSLELAPEGFVVSGQVDVPCIDGLPVCAFSDLCHENMEYGMMVTVFSPKAQSEIIHLLENAQVKDYLIWHSESSII